MISDKTRERLDALCAALILWLTRQIEVFHELVFLNPRMTARGVVLALVYFGARFGLHISDGAQAMLVAVIVLYLGISGRDKLKGETE